MIIYKFTDKKLSHSIQHSMGIELLSAVVKKIYKIDITESDISKGEHGKPYLRMYPEICFNISHCDGMIACIIDEQPCGIDCENLRKCRMSAAKRVLLPDEMNVLDALNGDDADKYFTSVWTLKEAFAKADGRGLSAMKHISFMLNENEVVSDSKQFIFMHTRVDGYFLSAAVNKNSHFGEILNADAFLNNSQKGWS